MDDPIRFGTDGWRAVIARDFTYANLSRIARATADWLKQSGHERPKIVLGYDTRFMGMQFAGHVAKVLAAEGVRMTLAVGPTPTPAISWATKAYSADAGVVITASHNPPEYNGYKIKASFGGPATPEMTAAVEGHVQLFDPHYKGAGGPEIREMDVTGDYVRYLETKFDIEELRESKLRIAHDAMFGSGQGIISDLLGPDQVVELRSTINPGFGGIPPEPIERNLAPLLAAVPAHKLDAGIANDGDADRIGVVDERGQMVTSHLVMALLVRHLHKVRGLNGAIVRTFAATAMLEKMGRAWGLPVETWPIGFKYVAPRFLETNVLVGGEESGGIAVSGHLCERDGLYVGLILLEMLLDRGMPLSALVQELFDEFGVHAYYRADVHTHRQPEVVQELNDRGGLKHIAGRDVKGVDTLDGYKHLTSDGWLLVRPSGTEPVLRVYAEAPTRAEAEEFVRDARQQLRF